MKSVLVLMAFMALTVAFTVTAVLDDPKIALTGELR